MNPSIQKFEWIDVDESLPPVGTEVLVAGHKRASIYGPGHSWAGTALVAGVYPAMLAGRYAKGGLRWRSCCFTNRRGYQVHRAVFDVTHWGLKPDLP